MLPAGAVTAGADSLFAAAPRVEMLCPPFVSFSGSGVLDSFEGLVKIPFPSSHWKYRTPATDPSFFPIGSSSTMPAHCPGANCVLPTNCTYPGLLPLTQILSPTWKSPLPSGVGELTLPGHFSRGTGFTVPTITNYFRHIHPLPVAITSLQDCDMILWVNNI